MGIVYVVYVVYVLHVLHDICVSRFAPSNKDQGGNNVDVRLVVLVGAVSLCSLVQYRFLYNGGVL